MGPESVLFWRLNPVSCVKFAIVWGMLPVKELKERSSTLSFKEKEVGTPPEKLLCWRKRFWSDGREVTSEGRSPSRTLDRRLRVLRASSLPRVFGGI